MNYGDKYIPSVELLQELEQSMDKKRIYHVTLNIALMLFNNLNKFQKGEEITFIGDYHNDEVYLENLRYDMIYKGYILDYGHCSRCEPDEGRFTIAKTMQTRHTTSRSFQSSYIDLLPYSFELLDITNKYKEYYHTILKYLDIGMFLSHLSKIELPYFIEYDDEEDTLSHKLLHNLDIIINKGRKIRIINFEERYEIDSDFKEYIDLNFTEYEKEYINSYVEDYSISKDQQFILIDY